VKCPNSASLRGSPRAPRAVLALLLAASVAGCRVAPPTLPQGPGLGAADAAPPTGVATLERPEWRAGDSFTYQRGGSRELSYRVEAGAGGGWRAIDTASARVLELDANFAQLGERSADGEWLVRFDPFDPILHWPLWPGKRWSGGFVRRAPGEPDVPVWVSYHCGEFESIEAPIGRVRALPIWRTLYVTHTGAAEGTRSLARTDLLWYAPEYGHWIRRLESGLLTDLTAFERAVNP